MGGAPTLIAEFGIPFDLNGGRAYRTGDSPQGRAAGAGHGPQLPALEANLLSGTVWNYNTRQRQPAGRPVEWRGFLDLFPDQQHDPADLDSGGRALQAVVRPYAPGGGRLPSR